MRDSPVPDAASAARLREQLSTDVQALARTLATPEFGEANSDLCAKFVTCALDNAALNSNWREFWQDRQLAADLFDIGSGGEWFFREVEDILDAPDEDYPRVVLEVAFLCLVCGFEGLYGIRDKKFNDLERLKGDLITRLPRTTLFDSASELGPLHFGNVAERAYHVDRPFPLFGSALIALASLAVLLVGLYWTLDVHSDSSRRLIASLGAQVPYYNPPAPIARAPDAPVAPQPPDWMTPMRQFCAERRLECAIDQSGALIVINGADAFASAARELTDAQRERLVGLGAIINLTSGLIKVSGHTDAKQFRSLTGELKNNFDLSSARAEFVKSLLVAEGVAQGRMIAEGLGDLRLLCKENNTSCDEQNRRVEISLKVDAR